MMNYSDKAVICADCYCRTENWTVDTNRDPPVSVCDSRRECAGNIRHHYNERIYVRRCRICVEELFFTEAGEVAVVAAHCQQKHTLEQFIIDYVGRFQMMPKDLAADHAYTVTSEKREDKREKKERK